MAENEHSNLIASINEIIDFKNGKPTNIEIVKGPFHSLPEFSPAQIKRIRKSVAASQRVFANILGVATKTVQAWEIGRNKPSGSARRLLQIIENNPAIVQTF